ncbi:MAG: DUF4864 domain-containing protein [Aestuariivirga sp.]|uniref:DUF4864 domain-containing protein n=1 Tax=Aestuariivirga sp. TaxID=2650926 RepID=UPI0038CFADD2
MRFILRLLAMIVLFTLPAQADELSAQDKTAFQSVISDQIAAFQADDGATAYGFASPTIRSIFPNHYLFMDMVKRGYQPVYRPKSFTFGEAGINEAGRPFQKMTIVGPDGFTYEALYSMERQPDGSWKINGCALVRAPDMGA